MAGTMRVWVVGCVAAFGLAISSCDSTPSVEQAAPVDAVVRIAHVEERCFETRVEAQGQWRSVNERTIVAPFAATVEAIAEAAAHPPQSLGPIR